MELLYLSRAEVEGLALPMTEIIRVVEEGFRRKGLGQTQMPPKTPIYPRPHKTFLHAMPAYVEGLEAAALKWVGGADDNYLQGLPTITGLLVLNDPETMMPLAVMDCTWITAMRTGAANAVAAKYLGPPQPRELALLGCGVQGRSNLLALQTTFPDLQQVRAYDLRPAAAEAFIAEMAPLTGLEIILTETPQQAITGADIIVTATFMPPDAERFIPWDWLKPGCLAAPVDYDVCFRPEVFQRAERFVTDDVAQMEYYRSNRGYFKDLPEAEELGLVVAGLRPSRQEPGQTTVAMCMGIGIDDAVTGQLVYQTALSRNAGTRLPL